MEIKIREAGLRDFPVLSLLTEKEGWNYNEDDFHWFKRVGGKTLVAVSQGEIVGMGTVFDYGKAGWVSNILVKPKDRGHGIGAEILMECVNRLGDKRTVALFSYERTTEFYKAHGFRVELEAYLVSLKNHYGNGRGEGVLEGTEVDAPVLEMDRECFGYERQNLLKEMVKRGGILKPRGCGGFAIVRKDPVEPSAGPVISDDRDAGNNLLLAALQAAGPNAKAVVVEEGIGHLNYEERIRRLYLGDPPKIDRSRAVAFAGLELG